MFFSVHSDNALVMFREDLEPGVLLLNADVQLNADRGVDRPAVCSIPPSALFHLDGKLRNANGLHVVRIGMSGQKISFSTWLLILLIVFNVH